jgi:hypothetical protein
MAERPTHDAEGRRIVWSPVISVETVNGTLELNWENTQIRFFSNNEEMNHVQHVRPDGQLCAFTPSQELLDQLMEAKFGYRVDPVADEASKEWYVSMQMGALEGELAT